MRAVGKQDIPGILEQLDNHLSSFSISPRFSAVEAEHWLQTRGDIMHSFVSDSNDDFCFASFYSLPTQELQTRNIIRTAYLFYICSSEQNCIPVMKFIINAALDMNFDVINCLDIMDNRRFIDKLEFRIGDGVLNYYLFNWQRGPASPQDIALSML